MVEVIAEAGITHGGVLKTAMEMADSALWAGATAVKYQTYDPGKLLRKNAPDRPLLEKLALSYKDFVELAKHCDDIGIEFMSTPGELDSLKFLAEECGVRRIKIGSDDLTYRPLIEAAYATGKPVILSTGMATWDEVEAVVAYGASTRLTLMHCVSLYPCPAEKANLRAIGTLKRAFPCKVGYSDHTMYPPVIYSAIALGATIIEKHFCPNGYTGPDLEVSLIPMELKMLINAIKRHEQILGDGRKEPCEEEKQNIKVFRKGKDGLRGLDG